MKKNYLAKCAVAINIIKRKDVDIPLIKNSKDYKSFKRNNLYYDDLTEEQFNTLRELL